MTDSYVWLMIAVISGVTVLVRFLPFIIFSGERQTPAYVLWLGRYLPYAIMGMLVVFCLKGISFRAQPHGIPEFIACAVTAALHVWKRNSLTSITGGTAAYMIMVQCIF